MKLQNFAQSIAAFLIASVNLPFKESTDNALTDGIEQRFEINPHVEIRAEKLTMHGSIYPFISIMTIQ